MEKEIPPVDRSKRVLTDGSPVPEDGSHTQLKSNGQQVGYVVLTEEERKKGFVRPVRQNYIHRGIRPKYPTRELTSDEKQQYAEYGYVLKEEYPNSSPEKIKNPSAIGRYWTKEQLNSGCGVVTYMRLALAETYARDPKFYTGTFCVGCGKHLPLEEFVWDGTDEIVGS